MSELKHYGIHGMRWGVRRFQNPDGTLTALGKKRYGVSGGEKSNKYISKNRTVRDLNRLDTERGSAQAYSDYYKAKAITREYKLQKKGASEKDVSEDYKLHKYNERHEDYQQLADRGKKMIDKIIQESANRNLGIYQTPVIRNKNLGYKLFADVQAPGYQYSAARTGVENILKRKYLELIDKLSA